jgi:hypothetical protein
MKYVQLAGYVAFSLTIGPAWAAPIFIDVGENCSKTVTDSITDRPCRGGDACRHRGERVTWVVRPGNNPFQVEFTESSPFGDSTSCLTDSGQACRIPQSTPDGSYDYNVSVDVPGCGMIDPKIVIN